MVKILISLLIMTFVVNCGGDSSTGGGKFEHKVGDNVSIYKNLDTKNLNAEQWKKNIEGSHQTFGGNDKKYPLFKDVRVKDLEQETCVNLGFIFVQTTTETHPNEEGTLELSIFISEDKKTQCSETDYKDTEYTKSGSGLIALFQNADI